MGQSQQELSHNVAEGNKDHLKTITYTVTVGVLRLTDSVKHSSGFREGPMFLLHTPGTQGQPWISPAFNTFSFPSTFYLFKET